MSLADAIATASALLAVQAFLVGFGIAVDQSAFDALLARIDTMEDRLRDAALADDSFPMPAQLASVAVVIHAHLERLGTRRTIGLTANLISVALILIIYLDQTTPEPPPGWSFALFPPFLLWFSSAVLFYMYVNRFRATKREVTQLLETSSVVRWATTTEALSDGDFETADEQAAGISLSLPNWPWASIAIAAARAASPNAQDHRVAAAQCDDLVRRLTRNIGTDSPPAPSQALRPLPTGDLLLLEAASRARQERGLEAIRGELDRRLLMPEEELLRSQLSAWLPSGSVSVP
jgi:hypothetical protein